MSHPCLGIFQNDEKPITNISQVSISINLDNIGLDMPYQKTLLKYQKMDNGCYITNAKSDGILLENQDFRKLFLDDLELVLKNQKNTIANFFVYIQLFDLDGPENQNQLAEEFLNMMRTHLGAWSSKIPAKRLNLGVINQTEIMSIVPYLDPKCLESIEMSASKYVSSVPIELDQFLELKHFKNLQNFQASKLIVNLPFEKLAHVPKVSIYWTSFTGEDLEKLKHLFLQTPTMKTFSINTLHINKDSYNKVLGQPTKGVTSYGAEYEKWLFPVPGTDQTLQFSLSGDCENWVFSVGRIVAKN